MRRIILASASPRRKELLEQIGLTFDILVSDAPEVITKSEPAEVVAELSLQKAEAAAQKIAAQEKGMPKTASQKAEKGVIVIGADTVVCQDGQIMGKPKDKEEAAKMLSRLAGNTHSVFTGVTVIADGAVVRTFSCETKVRVYPMTQKEIWDYIGTGEPMDKAGAYGIQGRFAAWVESIEGDYNNVVGLPVAALWQVLKAL